MSTNSIPQWLKDQVRSRETHCYRCHQPIDWAIPFFVPGHGRSAINPDAGTVEHIIPRSQRPDLARDPANCAASHQRCNAKAGARDDRDSGLGSPSRSW